MKAIESVLLFFCLIYLASCIDQSLAEASQDPVGYPNVDEQLWPHFQAYENAAENLGLRADLRSSGITATIEEIDENHVAGLCSYDQRRVTKAITIDKSFWDRAPYLYREYIVFHELGHCHLLQGHREACLSNGTWASMMRSGNGSCRDNYNLQTRDYYIQELFDQYLTP